LAASVKKIGNDTITLRSGITIACTTDETRRPADLLASIKLDLRDVLLEQITTREFLRIIMDAAGRGHPDTAKIERILGIEPGSLQTLQRRITESAFCRWQEQHALARSHVPQHEDRSSTSVPIVPRSTPAETENGYTTPEFEEFLASKREERSMRATREQRVLRRRPDALH
jgi:hypothetical protein